MNDRKQKLISIIKEAELSKIAQEVMNQTDEVDPAKAEQLADQVFEKILNDLDLDV